LIPSAELARSKFLLQLPLITSVTPIIQNYYFSDLYCDDFADTLLYTTKQLHLVVIRSCPMTEGLLDRYFRLLAGRLPAAEYGVIAGPEEPAATGVNSAEADAESLAPVCLC